MSLARERTHYLNDYFVWTSVSSALEAVSHYGYLPVCCENWDGGHWQKPTKCPKLSDKKKTPRLRGGNY